MASGESLAIRNLAADDSAADRDNNPSGASQAMCQKEVGNGVSGLIEEIEEMPSNRLIYLDEDVMRSVSARLLNDPRLFPRLKGRAGNDNVRLTVINDSNSIDPVYFAQSIWHVPHNETIIDIPPLDEATPPDLYPGAVIRVRAHLRVKDDLRPERMTLTGPGKERIHIEMAKRGVLSINRIFLDSRALYAVGQLRRLNPLSIAAAAILLLPASAA